MREKIRELFSKTKAQTILIRNFSNIFDPNFSYFSSGPSELFPNAFLTLYKDKDPYLIGSFFDKKEIKNEDIGVKWVKKEKELIKSLRIQLSKRFSSGKKIGLNLSIFPVNSFKKMKKLFKNKRFIDISKPLSEVRAIKTQQEIKKIKNAAKICEESLERFPEILRKFKTEKAIALEINHLLLKNGADTIAFPTIVASGANAAIIHCMPTNKKIKRGELVLVDFGAKANCYCSDLTRMFCSGKPSEKQKELFEIVLQAKETAQALTKPKAKASQVFKKTESFLKQKGFELQHGLGHGLGIETHDYPEGFRQKSETVLAPNMVLTIEPGIYGRFGGIRLEDDIAITEDSFRFLSKPQKEIIQI